MISPKEASEVLMSNFLLECAIPGDDFNREVADAFYLGGQMLLKEIVTSPELKVSRSHPILGKAYYCRCGVMFPNWEIESQRTNYCGNCGQKLR